MCNSTQVLLSWKYSSTLMSPADHRVLRLQCRNSILLIELSSPLVVWYRVHFAIGCLVLAPGRMVLSVTKNSYVTEIRAVVPVPVLICGVLFDLVSYQQTQVFLSFCCPGLGSKTNKKSTESGVQYSLQHAIYKTSQQNDGMFLPVSLLGQCPVHSSVYISTYII